MLRIQGMYFASIRCYASYASYCEVKRCADRVRSTTDNKDNKDEVLEGKFELFAYHQKETEYSFERFLSFNPIIFDFCCLC